MMLIKALTARAIALLLLVAVQPKLIVSDPTPGKVRALAPAPTNRPTLTPPQTCPDKCTQPLKVGTGTTKFVANCIYNAGSTELSNLCDGNTGEAYFGNWFTFTAPVTGCNATATIDEAFFGPYVYNTPITCPAPTSKCVSKQVFGFTTSGASTVNWLAAPGKTYLITANPSDAAVRTLTLNCVQTCPNQCSQPLKVGAGTTKFVANCIYNAGSTELRSLCDGSTGEAYFGNWFTFTAPVTGCNATATIDEAFFGPYVYDTPITCPASTSKCVSKQVFGSTTSGASTVNWLAAPGKTYLITANPNDVGVRTLTLSCVQTCPNQCSQPLKVGTGTTKFVANCIYNAGSTELRSLCDGNAGEAYFGNWFTFTAPATGCNATATIDEAFFGPYVYNTPITCPASTSKCVSKQAFGSTSSGASTVNWLAAPGKTYLITANPNDVGVRTLTLSCT